MIQHSKHGVAKTVSMVLGGILTLACGVIGYGGYRYHLTREELFGNARGTGINNGKHVETDSDLTNTLGREMHEKSDISDALTVEQGRNTLFNNQIEQIQGTVGTLVKLSQTDPELLKKYSKVSFLNENYIPKLLAVIDPQYLADKARPLSMHAEIVPHLTALLESAKNAGVSITVGSAYRSFGEQTTLKANYKVTYGTGANKFSADQGYSEHQLGTTLDFSTEKLGGALTGFEKTPAYVWLQKNAHLYGFVLSYPEHNAYYQFEPWHWRFVSIPLATKLHDENKFFYDLDQREINTYLPNVFDPQK